MPTIEVRERARGVRYAVRVRDPDPDKGKSGYTSATFATEPEAKQFVRDVDDRGVAWALAEYRRSKDAAAELTLDEWAAIHFDTMTKPAAATINRYKRIYRTVWSPHLGHMRLSQIERVHVAAAMKKAPGSDKTVKNAWGVLTLMLKVAVQDGKIPRTPTLGVTPPRRTEHLTEEHRYLTHAEFWQVLDATPPYWQPLIIMLAGTGMRWGELAALTVGDVDPEMAVVRITKAEVEDPDHPGQTIIGPPKTKKGRRSVYVGEEVLEAVVPLMEGRKRNERLFLPPKGGKLRHRTFYRDIWLRKCVGKSGIREPHPRLHDIRHSHVAWLIAAGEQLPIIQARLGHEKITTTIDTYGHLMPDMHEKAAAAASRVLGRRPEPPALG